MVGETLGRRGASRIIPHGKLALGLARCVIESVEFY